MMAKINVDLSQVVAFPSSCIRLLKPVLDDAYERIPMGQKAKDKAINTRLAELSKSYEDLTQGEDIDYSEPVTRFAYIYRYVSCHANIVREFIKENTELAALFDQPKVRVVSVGAEHGAKGVMYHKVAFDDAKTSGWGVQEVLSEGEHRCIALAAFLAELSMQPVASTVILDDPVSSLDHTRRGAVAKRLVHEATKRPVIVLTHDIVFLLFLQEQADQEKVGFTARFLDREKGALGIPVDGLPWYGMPLKKRVSWLRDEATRLKKVYKEESTETYDKESSLRSRRSSGVDCAKRGSAASKRSSWPARSNASAAR